MRKIILVAALLVTVLGLATVPPARAATCPPRCVHTTFWWESHPKAWWIDPNADYLDTGKTWMQTLKSPTWGDPWMILAKIHIGAMLNYPHPYCPPVPAYVDAAFLRAWELLHNQYRPGQVPKTAIPDFVKTGLVLGSFNLGLVSGFPSCGR